MERVEKQVWNGERSKTGCFGRQRLMRQLLGILTICFHGNHQEFRASEGTGDIGPAEVQEMCFYLTFCSFFCSYFQSRVRYVGHIAD